MSLAQVVLLGYAAAVKSALWAGRLNKWHWFLRGISNYHNAQ
jgi:hypothetical protein